MNPIVTVFCPAFNHERYIKQCLDGFVMQLTSFPVEFIVHDDASSDNTADIIKAYQKKYPDKIFPIFQSENQLSKDKSFLGRVIVDVAKGKYIAICEGDDYWTNPYKLQKQVDFLERNENFVLIGHSTVGLSEKKDRPSQIYPTIKKDVLKKKDIIFSYHLQA